MWIRARIVAPVAFCLLFSSVRFKWVLKLPDFPPPWLTTCFLKLPAWEDTKSHWLQMFDFSPLCIFKYIHKVLVWEETKSHWLHLFDFSPVCAFKWEFDAFGSEHAKSFFVCVFLQMHAQIACTRGCIVAIAAFDWFIFAVCYSLLLNLLIWQVLSRTQEVLLKYIQNLQNNRFK